MKQAVDTPADIARVQGRALLLWIAKQHRQTPRQSWSDTSVGERIIIMRQAAKDLGYAV